MASSPTTTTTPTFQQLQQLQLLAAGKGNKAGGAQTPAAYSFLTAGPNGLPSVAGVPMAPSGGVAYQQLSPDQRAQLLQSMISTSRSGGVPPKTS